MLKPNLPPTQPSIIPPPIDSDAVLAELRMEELRKLVVEKESRRCESLRLYEAMPVQEQFHASMAKKRIAYGSNRSGKTTLAIVEVARALTGQDPYGKWPLKDGRAILVAKNEFQIGEVFFRKLFRAGAFKIIRDAKTKQWRAFRPAEDAGREHEAKPAPPLIPERFIKGGYKSIAWKDKKLGVPSKVVMNNGWEVSFFSGDGEPPNGIDIDLALFDEEITNPRWYPEVSFRLGDRRGRFIWSATPQNGTEELRTLAEMAEAQRGTPHPDIESFKISIFDNVHFPKEELAASIREWSSNADQYKIRIEGEFATSSYLIYPDFSPAIHGCWEQDEQHPDGIEFDASWNYYMAVDPGKGVCAVTFWAIPPANHQFADQRFLFDELYLRQCNAEIFAQQVAMKTAGRYFSAFYIDPSSHRQDVIGGGKSVFQQYSEALERAGVISAETGSGFRVGANDIQSGILKVQSWLYVNPERGRPKLQYVRQRCPNFKMEMTKYRKRKVNEQWTDKPVDKDDHTLDTMRYFAMADPAWKSPPERKKVNRIFDLFKRLQEKERQMEMTTGIHLGPGSASRN